MFRYKEESIRKAGTGGQSMKNYLLCFLTIIGLASQTAFAFTGSSLSKTWRHSGSRFPLQGTENEGTANTKGFDDTDAASKGFVSTLTNLVNSLSPSSSTDKTKNAIKTEQQQQSTTAATAPKTPSELMERIRNDYVVNNYLWTGDIDLTAFDPNCRFTDPTLSFEGTDKFVTNLENLTPILNKFANVPQDCQSILLDIKLTDEYVQTRWNMVGQLQKSPWLFWKPKIDVTGQTKFWYNQTTNQVYFYDEEWEIPAFQALLQLITPPNTIPNSIREDKLQES